MSKDATYNPGSPPASAGDVGGGNIGCEGLGEILPRSKSEREQDDLVKPFPDTSVNKFTEHFQ